jgi:hypothetical protein
MLRTSPDSLIERSGCSFLKEIGRDESREGSPRLKVAVLG